MNIIKSCSKGILKKAPAFPKATGYAKLFPILKDQFSLIFLQKAFPSCFVSIHLSFEGHKAKASSFIFLPWYELESKMLSVLADPQLIK